MNRSAIGCFLLIFLIASGIVSAQSYSGDARRIAMGGIGNVDNLATRMIDDEREYTSIVIPIGLFQLIADRDRFDPNKKDKFDPILGMEYAANPLHFVFDRNPEGTRGKFISDIVNGDFSLSRDLSDYRGFVLTDHILSQGLINPSWGKNIKFRKREDGSFHGVYVGVGPYLSAKTDLNIDKGLTEILSSSTRVYKPNQSFLIKDSTTGQLALDVTVGYRGRFALPGRKDAEKSKRDGIYVGMNYHYLKGFAYENPDIAVRFDTDSSGFVTLHPATEPVLIDHRYSHSGSGFALDLGIGAVMGPWDFGFGANGLGNRINWDDLIYKQFKMESLYNGGDLVKQRLPIAPSLKVELPVKYSWNAGYSQKAWSAAVEISRGYQGADFHGGVEYRISMLEFRAGMRYGLDRWHPCGGFGLNLGKRFSVDYALFGSTTNIERAIKPAMALSLRLNRRQS